jgi:hypothetical protein
MTCHRLALGKLVRSLVLGACFGGATLGAIAGCAHTHATPPPPAAVAPTKPDHELAKETGIPVASTPQGLLRPGAEKRIQERLRRKELLRADQCNGQLDNDTREALRTFQKSEGLPTTGLPSYETIDHLGLDLDQIFHHTTDPVDPTVAPAPSK